MSINFKQDITEEQQAFAKELFGDRLRVIDKRTALLDSREIFQKEMKTLANKTNQPVTVELNDIGDIKTMSDGTQYKATSSGWQKLA